MSSLRIIGGRIEGLSKESGVPRNVIRDASTEWQRQFDILNRLAYGSAIMETLRATLDREKMRQLDSLFSQLQMIRRKVSAL